MASRSMRSVMKILKIVLMIILVSGGAWLLVHSLATLAGPRNLPRPTAPDQAPTGPSMTGAGNFPATRWPAAPAEAVEQIDTKPIILREDQDTRRFVRGRRRNRGTPLLLRFYRAADGRLLPRLDTFLPATRDQRVEAQLTPGPNGAYTARATISTIDGQALKEVEFKGVLIAGQETFTAQCLIAQLAHTSMTTAQRSTVTLDCQAYRLPQATTATEVLLTSPLTTALPAPRNRGDQDPPRAVIARLRVPDDVPDDLVVGAYCTSYHGEWFQTPARPLAPGTVDLRFDLTGTAALCGEPAGSSWSPVSARDVWESGLYFASHRGSTATIAVERLVLETRPTTAATAGRLLDLAPDASDVMTGTRWECRFLPEPLPANPFIPELFAADLEITDAAGVSRRYPAFFDQPMGLVDRGDTEVARPAGPARFAVRFRPQRPGRYRCRLLARWGAGEEQVHLLPDLMVAGAVWDDYVRVDAGDPRFFSTGSGDFYWPVTLNLRSVYDVRGQQRLATRLTPDRGLYAYRAYVDRLATAGGNLAEVWMASWNLALEWNRCWPGYGGICVYNQGNAARVDALLDHAWSRGVRLLLVINNHGQASARSDREWSSNPWNAWNGGPLAQAAEFFRDPAALEGQHRLRRYLVGRFGDHPAIFGWKLFSEINLTDLAPEDRVSWHRQAAADFHRLDHYDHPVTTHWAGDFHNPFPEVCALPEVDFIAIDAYHAETILLTDLLAASTGDSTRGLARFGKPLVTTEFGGSAQAAPPPRLLADHLTGTLAAFVSGHGVGPMLWWFEWVDQGNRWQPLRASQRFIAGEDLRGDPGVLASRVVATPRRVWSGVWQGQDRLLVYLVDADWGITGGPASAIDQAEISFSTAAPPGRYRVEWWDPDTGRILTTDLVYRPQGFTRIAVPPFRRHLAAKFIRLDSPDGE